MKRLEVHKFGGTSVGDVERIRSVAGLMAKRSRNARIVVVTSATAGTTDLLETLGSFAVRGEMAEVREYVELLLNRHLSILTELKTTDPEKTQREIRRFVDVVRQLTEAVGIQREMTPRVRDRILAAGEKIAARLLAAAIEERGAKAKALDADQFLLTDNGFGQANPIHKEYETPTREAIDAVLSLGVTPVVTGFCGRAPDGATTTLGRGGSDFSATLIGAALKADEVTIWTDVDGVMSANPKVVADAKVIGQLNYREAAEMSFYGAKVLHQRTMIPAAVNQIPIWTRNSLNPTSPGTLVSDAVTPGSHPVKAVSAIPNHALISIEGKGMAGVPGISARLFGVIASRKISVTMYSQSSSEASICLALPDAYAESISSAVAEEFELEFIRGYVEKVEVRRDVGLLAVVGMGMAKTPGVAGRTMEALAKQGINILAIAQGSSELNITLAVDSADVDRSLRALHSSFGLHRIDTGAEKADGLDLLVFGAGNIGRELVRLIVAQRENIHERFGLNPRVVAMADRSGFVFNPKGFDEKSLTGIVSRKESGAALADLEGGVKTDGIEVVERALAYRLTRPIFVDTSDADGTAEAFIKAFERGCDVVTANKKPLAGSLDVFSKLMDTAAKQGRVLKAEATVGAGLPVIDTLEMLRASGDRLSSAEGSLSGTLGFIMSRLEEGLAFSKAVVEAHELGFTEPDPAQDLTGEDVKRKALILGRLSGMVDTEIEVELTGLVDKSLVGMKLTDFLKKIEELDQYIADRVADARKRGHALRYLARVERGKVSVGPVSVPVDSPAGRLGGAENLIVFRSMRYEETPLVITGPGAGIDVTAMGVFGDILRIASERRGA